MPRTKKTVPDNRRVIYRLHPKQAEAMRLLGLAQTSQTGSGCVQELLWGGAAGAGKSLLLRAVGVDLCARWPGAVVALFRRTYPELEESHCRWIQEEVQAPHAQYEVGRRQLRFKNGSILEFRHAEEERSVYTYNTAEWAGLLVDQAEMFTEFMLRFLRSRVRAAVGAFGGTWRPVIVYTANPGGPGHQYLHDAFVAPGSVVAEGQPFEAPLSDGGLIRAYLPARLGDNPSLDAEQYKRQLEGLPPHLIRAYLEGDWSAVVGAFFSAWRAMSATGEPWHVWPADLVQERYGGRVNGQWLPPRDWPVWCGVDGGVRDPWCCLFLTRAPGGRVIVFGELYGAGIEVPDQAEAILRACREWGVRPEPMAADPAMFARRANLSVSDAQVYWQNGVGLSRGNNHRAQGWRRLTELLGRELDDGWPRLVVVQGQAPNLVRTLPAMLADPLHPEDVWDDPRRKQEDHPCDSLRYACTPVAVPEYDRRGVDIELRDGEPDHEEAALAAYDAVVVGREPAAVPVTMEQPSWPIRMWRRGEDGRLVELAGPRNAW